ncbi:uncharacterized protein [Amphiura filiformis]|uniref:uncharacterized protein n=1 Tax=Amphiura filiformis TaxID=82378 RepID=UPI003B2184C7
MAIFMFIILVGIPTQIYAQGPRDITAPSIARIPDIRLSTSCNTECTRVAYVEPPATDDSGIANLISRSHTPGQCFPVGTTPVTYQYGDPSGNTASYSFNIIIVEVRPSMCAATFPIWKEICRRTSHSDATRVVFEEPTTIDICSQARLVDRSHTRGDLFSVGSTRVSYSFRDGSGNMMDCGFNVIVTDNCPVISHEPPIPPLSVPQMAMAQVNYDNLMADMGGTYQPSMLSEERFYNRTVIPFTPEQEEMILQEYGELFVNINDVHRLYNERRRKRQAAGTSRVCEVQPPGNTYTLASFVAATDLNQNIAQIVRLNNHIQWTFNEECGINPSSFPCSGSQAGCGKVSRNQLALIYVIPAGMNGIPFMSLQKPVKIYSCAPLR